jgi:hypothetical protein
MFDGRSGLQGVRPRSTIKRELESTRKAEVVRQGLRLRQRHRRKINTNPLAEVEALTQEKCEGCRREGLWLSASMCLCPGQPWCECRVRAQKG